MRRRVLLAAVAAAVVWVVVANNLPAAQAPAADWSDPRVARTAGITAFYPRAWQASMDGPMLIIWSGGAPKKRSTELANHIPDGAIWVWLFNNGPLEHMNGFVKRPRHFKLRDEDRAFQSCGFGFAGWNLTFRDGRQAVQAIVGLGSGGRKSDALELLNRLRVSD